MDKDSTNNGDKRNWRERLGINAGKEMPRIAEEFQGATPPRPAVKPAPMAPRPQGKPVLSRANPVAQPGAQERLADKLKAQREAQERLAEQRVSAARKSVEVKAAPAPATTVAVAPTPIAPKPKFTFAEETQAAKPVATIAKPTIAPPQERVIVPPPVISTPPRPSLGMDRPALPPRPATLPPPPVTSQRPPMPQQRYAPQPSAYPPAQNYGAPPPPAYRPIDPANRGYQPSAYQPQQPYTPQPSYTGQRMAPPPLAPATRGYNPQELRPAPRVSNYREDDIEDDIFDEPRATRRTTANEYQKAYRDAEQGYDEDMPQSRGPWLPLMLLALAALVAGGLVWFYQTNMAAKPTAAATTTSAPVVEAPAEPPKAVPEPAAAQPANTPSKKLIYDRIVGDREVLGGDVMQSEEVPTLPQDNSATEPAAVEQGNDAQPAGGEDVVPLPLPPPPGENGTGDQQGAAPSNKSSNEASLTPAAGDSQAAASSQGTGKMDGSAPAPSGNEVTIAKSEPTAAQPTSEQAPAPGELASTEDPAEKILNETAAPTVAPVVKKKVEAAKKPAKKVEKSLGSKPVVLVPPSKLAKAAAQKKAANTSAAADVRVNEGTSLYDGEDIGIAEQSAPATPAAPTKKRRTLSDLFSNDDNTDAAPQVRDVAAVETPDVAAPAAPKPKVAVLPETAAKKATGGGGYVVQLASFRSRDEANSEYNRLRGKHPALGSLGPIVTEAVVGGSTRYRLAAGTLGSRADASAVCAKLFAGGERDCIVRQQ